MEHKKVLVIDCKTAYPKYKKANITPWEKQFDISTFENLEELESSKANIDDFVALLMHSYSPQEADKIIDKMLAKSKLVFLLTVDPETELSFRNKYDDKLKYAYDYNQAFSNLTKLLL